MAHFIDRLTLQANGYATATDRQGRGVMRKIVRDKERSELYTIDLHEHFDVSAETWRYGIAVGTFNARRLSPLARGALTYEVRINVPEDMSLDELEVFFFGIYHKQQKAA